MKNKEASYKLRIARKHHVCQWCRGHIEPGGAYINERAAGLDGAGTAYHAPCYDIACGKPHKTHVEGDGLLFPVEVEA